tara:strand:- start:6463 stop:7401 length:939 start_codon:yes stop_codon:yes gene_type:complete
MIKIFTLKEDLKFSSELLILFGLLENNLLEESHNYNEKGISRYYLLKEACEKYIEYVKNVEECNFIVLPIKFRGLLDSVFKKYDELSKKNNKRLLCFFNDDSDEKFNIPENVILYRTSFYKSTKLINEKPLIVYSPDYFNNKILDNDTTLSIAYCGHTIHGRKLYLNMMYKSDIKCDFLLRRGFWAAGMDKRIARKEYFTNMENNLFVFCYRGAGNFSYRLYETFMMGRIPIFINTDCVLPYWDEIEKHNFGLMINEEDIISNKINLIETINKYYIDNKDILTDIQKNNRSLWEKYWSPYGFIENLVEYNTK